MAEWRGPSAEGPATRWRKGFSGPAWSLFAHLGPGLPTDRGRARAGGGQPWRAATLAGRGGGNPGNSKGNARAALAGQPCWRGQPRHGQGPFPHLGPIEKDDEASPAREEDEAVAEKVHNS